MSSELDNVTQATMDKQPEHQATQLFVRMWAIAHILHLAIANQGALDTPWNIAVVGLAISLLLRPRSGLLLVALLVAQLVEYAAEMPFSPDHWALVSFVNIAILITMLANRSAGVDSLEKAFPAARIILLTAYGAAALSKWNTAFLDPVTSCANAIARAVSFGLVGPLGDSHFLNIGAAVTETMVFAMLVVPATRHWGVLLGLVFHLSLSASPVMAVGDFTSTVYALFMLFLRGDVIAAALGRVTIWSGRSGIVRDARRHPPATAVMAFAMLGLGGYVSGAAVMAVLYVLAQCYFGAVLLAVALALRPLWHLRTGSTIGSVRLLHVPVLILTAAWALNPYLGLRTTGSFTMFSNLTTESPHPNHLFMPEWRVTSWQNDMVSLRSSSDEQLQTGADNRLAVPLMALRRMAMDDPGLEVSGVLHGQLQNWGSGKTQAALEPLPWWEYKLFLFRPVPTDGRPFCAQS